MADASKSLLDEMIENGHPAVRIRLAQSIGEAMIQQFERAGLSFEDAAFASLQLAQSIPVEMVRKISGGIAIKNIATGLD